MNANLQLTASISISALAVSLLITGAVNAQATTDVKATPVFVQGAAAQAQVDKSSLSKSLNGGKFGPFMRSMMHQKSMSGSQPVANPFIRTNDQQQVQVYLKLSHAEQLDLDELVDAGVNIEIVNKSLRKVQGWIETDRLDTLAAINNIEKITAPSFARPRAGSVSTQGDAILRANQLRNMGFRGQGVRVGVVSDGSNNWTSARATGDLPQSITRYGSCTVGPDEPQNCRSAGTCNEGTAMAEIIHDLAPDAQLAIAAVSTSLEFIQQINRLANQFMADVIVDDLGFFGEPFFEDGDIAKAVAALPSRVLYVSSAGNSNEIHYTAPYNATSAEPGFAGYHDFNTIIGRADDVFHGFLVPARRGVFVVMQWSDALGFEATQTDMQLDILTPGAGAQTSDIDNDAADAAIEAVCVYNPGANDTARFAAALQKGSSADIPLKMYFLGSNTIEHPITSGSIFGHPSVPRALAIGSINASDAGNDSAAFYSSRGPTQITFPSAASRQKPDLVAIDGVSVTGAGGFRSPFFGTSAAAPHVAGIAAQLMSVSRFANAGSVRDALINGAIDLGVRGQDTTYGYGRVDALRAKDSLQIRSPSPIPPIMLLLGDEDS